MKKYRLIGWCKILKDILFSWFLKELRLNKNDLSFWIQNRIGRL